MEVALKNQSKYYNNVSVTLFGIVDCWSVNTWIPYREQCTAFRLNVLSILIYMCVGYFHIGDQTIQIHFKITITITSLE